MSNLNKRTEFNKKVNELFLSDKTRNTECGPVRSEVFELLDKYNIYLLEHEKIQIKERMLFLTQYLMHCRHCARPIDWILIEKLIENCLII